MEDHKAVAESVLSYIVHDDVESLKLIITTSGDFESWRHIFRYELDIEQVIQVGGILQYDIVVPKLIFWGSPTISGHHLAALRGVDDVLRLSVCELDIGVNVKLQSGITALHIACFGGQLDTAKMLIDELHADVNATDDYGWTALHYAAVEGQFQIVELLISRSIDILARDKDGASAAFRAHTAGHEDVVCLISSALSETDDDLLNIAEDNYAEIMAAGGDTGTEKIHESLYTVVNKKRTQTTGHDASNESTGQVPDDAPSSSSTNAVRRMISEQLVEILEGGNTESPYQVPIQQSTTSPSIGYNTLTRVVREELHRFREDWAKKIRDQDSIGPTTQPMAQCHDNSCELYEEIAKYSSVVDGVSNIERDEYITEPSYPPPPVPSTLPHISHLQPTSHGVPPLPKRGNKSTLAVDSPTLFQTLQRIEKSATVMEFCFTTLADNGLKSPDAWKQLGRALPFYNHSADKVEKLLKAIELQYPRDKRQQVMALLGEWRKSRGELANVETLLKSLRQCGLSSDADVLEMSFEQSLA